MTASLLYTGPLPPSQSGPFWQDLQLDQLTAEICRGHPDPALADLFTRPVSQADVQYRQAIFRDLAQPAVLEALRALYRCLEQILAWEQRRKRFYCVYQKQWLLLRDFQETGQQLLDLEARWQTLPLHSHGLQLLREALDRNNRDQGLPALVQEAETLLQDLSQVRFSVHIRGNHVELYPVQPEPDFAQELAALFAPFRDGTARDYTYGDFSQVPTCNRVEEELLEGAARIYPALFSHLANFCAAHGNAAGAALWQLHRELPFYLACVDFFTPLAARGLPFCLPRFSDSGTVEIVSGFDLQLAWQQSTGLVCNEFYAASHQRRFTITGGNQGGKTTFAKMVGQIFYGAALGLPVPGTRVTLFPWDHILTHFEREEAVSTENGKLMDDLQRLSDLLSQATDRSLLILNETFSSTTLADGSQLARLILAQISRIGALCLYVTFLDLGDAACNLKALVAEDGTRTYRVVPAPPDGQAYALTLARAHHLLYEQILEVVPQ